MYEYEVKNRIPILFALSTCPRCIRMKKFLDMNQVKSLVVDYDLLPQEEKRQVLRFLQPINPLYSFPTLVVGDVAVIGEDYEGAKEVLNIP
ncbi:glutaredoxin family protein [candidate division KSB1 bacterium]|nr:glutaredoxin family protein [candidate division KSB1 bacterium]